MFQSERLTHFLKNNKNMAKKYILELTEEQYDLIALSVEVVHRISCGQVEELDQIVPEKIDRDLLMKLKEQAFPELAFNESYKWCGGYKGSDNEEFNKIFSHFQAETYALYREMLHIRTVNKGVDNVYQSPTLRCEGVDIPKITIKEVEQL